MFEDHPHIAQAFWAKVDRSAGEDGCWPWIDHYTKGQPNHRYGYHRFYLPGTCWRVEVAAHRFAYELISEMPVPPELVICHRCDNTLCVNPRHLWPDTIAANNADRSRKGRSGKPSDPETKNKRIQAALSSYHQRNPGVHRGSNNQFAKLNEDVVREIRALAAQGMSHPAIAQRFDISKTTVFDVVHRRRWAHVE